MKKFDIEIGIRADNEQTEKNLETQVIQWLKTNGCNWSYVIVKENTNKDSGKED